MDTREVATDVDYGTDTSPANIARMLRTMHPFHTYFEYVASRRYPRKASSNARIEQMINDHRVFYRLARTLDVLLVLVLEGWRPDRGCLYTAAAQPVHSP